MPWQAYFLVRRVIDIENRFMHRDVEIVVWDDVTRWKQAN